jgi:hypothetical protein
MSTDSQNSLGDKIIVPVIVGVLVAVIGAVIVGEGRFAPPSTSANQPSPIPPSSTAAVEADSEQATSTKRELPTPTAAPTPTPIAEERDLTSLARANASSILPEEDIPGLGLVRYDPVKAIDGDPATSWVEGVTGAGIGEQLTLTFPRPIVITRFGIRVGFDRDDNIFYKNHRVHRARLLFSGGVSQDVQFQDRRGIQYLSIASVATTSIVIVIEDVYPGSTYDDTPIAEVEVWGYETP